MPGRWLQWLAQRLPGIDEPMRHDLAESIRWSAQSASIGQLAAEGASLVGLSLTLQARTGTSDNRLEAARQGVHLAMLVVAAGAAALAWHAGYALTGALNAGLVVAVASGAARLPLLLALLAGTAAMSDVAAPAFLPGALIVGALVRSPHDRRACTLGAGIATIGMAALWLVCQLLPAVVAPLVATGSAVTVLVFLLLGWFDPRYAVAALAITSTRLAASTLAGEQGTLVDFVTTSPDGMLLPRISLMLAGVIVGGWVAAHALHRRVGSQ